MRGADSTRARYKGAVGVREITFDTMPTYETWRERGRRLAMRLFGGVNFFSG